MSTSAILPNGRICRYSLRERVVHWIAGISYLYLLLTGLAFWSPWLFWLATLFGGGTVSRELHPWTGLVFVVAVFFMYGLWANQMHTTQADREFWRAVPHYIRNEDEQVPAADRFNAGQKILFWGFFWCGILLLLSGLILWFPHLIPWSLRYLRYAAVIIHPVFCAPHDWPLYRSRLYGYGYGTGLIPLDGSRRCVCWLGEEISSHLVRTLDASVALGK